MQLYEMIALPFYLAVLSLLGLILREWRYRGADCAVYWMPALWAHFIGVLAFDAVYVFYYGGGDTTTYHAGATIIRQTLTENNGLGWQLMTMPAGERTLQTAPVIDRIGGYYEAANTLIVMRIAAIAQLFTLGSFWISSLLFSVLSFLGLWALFRVMLDLYPRLLRHIALAVLFVPSVIFWGTGIMKDTLSIAFLGFLVYGVYHLFIKRDQVILPLLLIPISLYIVLSTKAYIVVGFAPAVIYWIVAHGLSSIGQGQLRALTRFSIAVFVGFVIYWQRNQIWSLGDRVVQQFVQLAISFQGWHGFITETLERSSGYSLGDIEFTPLGILKKMPASVNATLFRPYFYEANSPVMLLSAVESSALLLGSLYVWLRAGIWRTWRLIARDHFAVFCLLFSVLFAFAVGFASYNFGALVRYKIPCMPFYIALLFIVWHRHKEDVALRK